MNKYFNMNEVPIGSKIKVKESNLVGHIVEVFHFPTTFKIEFKDGSSRVYKTNEIELLDDLGKTEENE